VAEAGNQTIVGVSVMEERDTRDSVSTGVWTAGASRTEQAVSRVERRSREIKGRVNIIVKL
jgi:hypothetical protein